MRKRLLALYPEAWRERYGDEMKALLEETPPGLVATLDLARGALFAHLRPVPPASPAARARGTIAGVLGSFILFCGVGAAFAKTTENFDYVEHVHPLLGVTHAFIVIVAVVAVAALALAAMPIALVTLTQARRRREGGLVKLIAIPPVAIAVFLGSIGLLVLWLNAHHQRAGWLGWPLLALCLVCAVGSGFACWAAPRAIMRRIDVPTGAFALSVPAIGLVALCMLAMAAATGAFLIGIAADAPRVGAMGNDPAQLIDVTTSIAIEFAAMLFLGTAAGLSAVRGLRVVRVRG